MEGQGKRFCCSTYFLEKEDWMIMKKLYKNARLADAKELQDFLVENGRFAAIGANLSADDARWWIWGAGW